MKITPYSLITIAICLVLVIAFARNRKLTSSFSSPHDLNSEKIRKVDSSGNNLEVGHTATDSQSFITPRWAKLSPEQARIEIENARKNISDLEIRGITTSNILHRLSKDGYVDEAWQLIDSNYGLVREREIGRVIEGASIPIDRKIIFLSGLTDKHEIISGCRGIMDPLTTEQLLKLNLAELNLVDKSLESSIKNAMSEQYFQDMMFFLETKPIDYKDRVAELVQSGLNRAKTGSFGISQLREMLAEDPNGTSFTRWDQTKNLTAGAQDNEDIIELQRNVISGMILSDATTAMDQILLHTTSHPDSSFTSDAISSWYRQDSGGANAWIQEHIDNIPQKRKRSMDGH